MARFVLLKKKLSFLRLKKIWIPLVLGIVGIIVFFLLNFFEKDNDCSFSFILKSPFIICYENLIPQFSHDDCLSGEGYGSFSFCSQNIVHKPLILLYPQKDTPVDVSLEFSPWFSATFPEYNNHIQWWSVLAYPDGTLIDQWTHQTTYGLFWEWNPSKIVYDLSKWFVVPWSQIREFLYKKLTEIGLNIKEKSDFIMYWYPKLQSYPYVQITFAWKDYTDMARLNISPTPDSLLRVFMIAKPLKEYKLLPPQDIKQFDRKWFSVVEWWGTIVE